MPKITPLKGQNHKITSNSATMSIWSLNIGRNMKTNWYKHVLIYFKHSKDVEFYLFSFKVCKRMHMAKKCHERGQNYKIDSNSATMSIWCLKIGKNLKTNRYKHVIIHFKNSLDINSDLSSLKVCKKAQNDQKVSPKGVKITKSPVIQQLCQFGV